jgi:hypothetical protein
MTTTIPTVRQKKTAHQVGRAAIKQALDATEWSHKDSFLYKSITTQFDHKTEAAITTYMLNIGAFQFKTGTMTWENELTKMGLSILVSCGNVHIFQSKPAPKAKPSVVIMTTKPITKAPLFLGWKREVKPVSMITNDPLFLGWKREVSA